jgi:hypothetical protein
MENFNPKQKSEGLGDTIAKITSATGLDKVAEALAKAAGKEDCGCNRRREALNKFIPYKKPKIQTTPLDEIVGNYEVLQDIYCTLPEIGNTVLNKGTILTIGKNHPLYDDVKFYYENNIIKKL